MQEKMISGNPTEIIMLDNGACVPLHQVQALGLDATTVTVQEYKEKMGNFLNHETYKIIEIRGKRACMVKNSFRNALVNITNRRTNQKINAIDKEIEMLQESIAKTEKNIMVAKKELYSELKKNEVQSPLTTYVTTVLHEPSLQEELLTYYKRKVEELEQVKQIMKERSKQRKTTCINSKSSKKLSHKYKLYVPHLFSKREAKEQTFRNENIYQLGKVASFPEEELAYRKQVYQIVNQFLDVSYGDEQGRKQFYNLISSCTNGYMAIEESSKTK